MVIRDSYHNGFHRSFHTNKGNIVTTNWLRCFLFFKDIFKKYLTIYFKSLKLKSFKENKKGENQMKMTLKQIFKEIKKMDEIIASMNGIANRLYIQICGNGLDEIYDGTIENVERDMKVDFFEEFINEIMKAEFNGSDTAYIEDSRDGMKYSITIALHQ